MLVFARLGFLCIVQGFVLLNGHDVDSQLERGNLATHRLQGRVSAGHKFDLRDVDDDTYCIKPETKGETSVH